MGSMDAELIAQLNKMGSELMRRAAIARKQESYSTGASPLPKAIVQARITKAYRMLMPMAEAPWASVIVNSVLDGLEVSGIRDDNEDAAKAAWEIWQNNAMDSESKLGHEAALTAGRAFALVWPDPDTGEPEISLDSAEQMIVQYREGSRRHRVAALRYWVEGDRPMATLYRREAIYKFQGPKNSSGFNGTQWERREEGDEPWPLPNKFGVVPAVELAVNRKLKPGSFGYARGEFEHCTGLLDRINLLTFLGLVVAFYQGFPLRGVIGDKILTDDNGNTLPPFKAGAQDVFQLEKPDAKIVEFKAADRGNLSIFGELQQLAYVSKTSAQYFPMETGVSNISADAIRALRAGQDAKVGGHKGSLGEGHEGYLRLACLMSPKKIVLSPAAELQWKDHEFRSLAERADAASKLKDVLPWQVIAEKYLNATSSEIARWSTMRGSDAIGQLLAAAANPTPVAA